MDKYNNYYFQDDKLRLRLWEPKDYESSYANELDSKCMALVHEELPLPTKRKVINMQQDSAEPNENAPAFTITDLDDNYIGHIHFNYINERHGTFSIGLLLNESARGKGYGKAALFILMKYAFEERRLHKFEGYCYDENIASIKLMESLGCIKEGMSRECVFMNGKYHNRLIYGMTSNEFYEKYK
jgi:RimJ/RimL family protein N-acetyltransferase